MYMSLTADYLAAACREVAPQFADCTIPTGDFAHDVDRGLVWSSQSLESFDGNAEGREAAIEHAVAMKLFWSAVVTRLENERTDA